RRPDRRLRRLDRRISGAKLIDLAQPFFAQTELMLTKPVRPRRLRERIWRRGKVDPRVADGERSEDRMSRRGLQMLDTRLQKDAKPEVDRAASDDQPCYSTRTEESICQQCETQREHRKQREMRDTVMITLADHEQSDGDGERDQRNPEIAQRRF